MADVDSEEQKLAMLGENQAKAVKDEDVEQHAWEQALVPDVKEGNAQDALLESCRSILRKFGSASRYLRQRYTPPEAQAFVQRLSEMQKLHVGMATLHPKQLPETVGTATVTLPLAAFSLSEQSSVKPDADMAVVMQLVEMILRQGFLTEMEPLQVTQSKGLMEEAEALKITPPWQHHGSLLPFSLGTVKGKTRVYSLLMLLSVMLDNDADMQARSVCSSFRCVPCACVLLAQAFHPLIASLQAVHAKVVMFQTKRAELLHNFSVSVRGSIRKAPSVWTWVASLRSLKVKGDSDMTSVIKSYNESLLPLRGCREGSGSQAHFAKPAGGCDFHDR